MFAWLLKWLDKEIGPCFYGQVTITFQNSKVCDIKKTEVFKKKDLEVFDN